MRVSFYRNLIWLIGILVAVEILLKIGYQRGLIMLIADLAVVLLLTFLLHRMRASGYDETAERLAANQATDDLKTEAEWQKKHDQWWRKHRQLKHAITPTKMSSRPTTPGATVNLSQLERSNHQLKNQIKYLNRKITVLRNDSSKNGYSYQNAKWYRQIIKMKKQIARLKSEYR